MNFDDSKLAYFMLVHKKYSKIRDAHAEQCFSHQSNYFSAVLAACFHDCLRRC